MVSPDALNELVQLSPHGSLTQNFEAVIKVEVIDGSPGADNRRYQILVALVTVSTDISQKTDRFSSLSNK